MVEYGTRSPHGGDRLGEVVRECREYGEDGYLIRPLNIRPGEGYLPSTYPGRMVIEPTMSRWTRGRDGWQRNYSEIKREVPAQNDGWGPAGYPAPQPSATWDGTNGGMPIVSHPAHIVARIESERAVGSNARCLWCAGSPDIVTDADAQLCRVHLAEFDGVSVAQLDRADDAAAYDQL